MLMQMEETITFPQKWSGEVLRYISEAKLLHLRKVLLLVHVGQNQTQERPVAWNITPEDLVSSSSETQGRIVNLGGRNG